jgi:hypothetical protein
MMALSNTGRADKVPFVATEEWLQAFTEQMAEPTFYDAAWRYAERRGRMVQHVQKLDPEAYGQELVQDIIDDTLEGTIVWDPKRVTLLKHVRDAIKSRSRHHYHRACRRRHHSLAYSGIEAKVDEHTAAAHRETEVEQAERRRHANEVLDRIRNAAAGDVEVERILDAHERGAETRAEILHVAGLTKLQYDAARKRLDRLIETLPSQLITHALRPR